MKAINYLLVPLWVIGAVLFADEPIAAPRIEVDYSKAPECEAFAKKAKTIAEEWYPRINEILNGKDKKLPYDKVVLSFEPMDGVANTSGNHIRIAADWIKKEPNDYGMVIHEMTHVVQNYHGGVFWATEGIADYVRYERYEPGKQKWKIDPDKSSYRQGYGIAGAFLAWLEKNKDREIIQKLNAALHDGSYKPQLFQKYCGAGIGDLWTEFADTYRKNAKP